MSDDAFLTTQDQATAARVDVVFQAYQHNLSKGTALSPATLLQLAASLTAAHFAAESQEALRAIYYNTERA